MNNNMFVVLTCLAAYVFLFLALGELNANILTVIDLLKAGS